MADMTTIKGRIAETIYPNGQGAITAESHQALLLEMVDDINTKKADQSELIATRESLDALEQKVDNLPLGEEFDKEGNYPSLRVGTADTAIDLAGRGESVPASFGFRASGGKSIKDGRAYIKRIKGNSVVWNQKFRMEAKTIANNGVTCTLQNDNSIQLAGQLTNAYFNFGRFPANVATHKYLFVLSGATSTLNGKAFTLLNRGFDATISNGYAYIFHTNSDPSKNTYIGLKGFSTGDTINETVYVNQYDLTQMFQAGNEPTTIEDFYARVATLGVDMNAYNEGQVIHCNTESIKSVGDNAWDEEWESGSLSVADGGNLQANEAIRNKNYIKVLPKQGYYFKMPAGYRFIFYDEQKNYISGDSKSTNQVITTPSNCHYLKFSVGTSVNPIATYNHDIMISLVHSGWKVDTDAGYQPYWQDTLPLPIIRKYFPQGMKKAGTAHDEIRFNKASGKWEAVQRIGEDNMWELDWGYNESLAMFYVGSFDKYYRYMGLLTTEYPNVENSTVPKKIFAVTRVLRLTDPSYTDAATFKAMLQDKQMKLYYELAEPIVTELDAEDQNFRDYYNVADFGTEMSQSSVPSAPFSADIIYQFNAVDMIREHEIEITELQSVITEQQSVIATMQAQLTSLINGGQ